jgi:TatD DNase family protein
VPDEVTTIRWTDNHCHLDPKYEDGLLATAFAYASDVVADAAAHGVTRMINVATSYNTSSIALEVARQHPGEVWATGGVHPHEARSAIGPGAVSRLGPIEGLLDAPEMVAVGECGLDYHYDHSPREQQREVFAAQVALAHKSELALVIHSREAWDDTFAILESEGVPERTVFHCFTGGPAEAERALAMGTSLSFSGIVTFPAASELREAVAMCPIERLLVETDSPYLTPVPHRGRPNRPAFVPLVGEKVAEVKGLSVQDVASATWDNATTLYRLAV